MKKKNRYIIVGISLIFIALLVTIYSAYTYSVGADNNQIQNIILIDEATFIPLSLDEEIFSVDNYTATYELDDNQNNTLPDSYTLTYVPENRTQPLTIYCFF